MGIKLIAIDLDDTLLDSRRGISRPAREAIQAVRRQGVLVTLATGRMYRHTVPFAHQLQINLPLITYQGALVKYSDSGEVIYNRTLPAQRAIQIIKLLQKENICHHIYSGDQLYLKEITEPVTEYLQVTETDPVLVEDLLPVISKRPPEEIMAIIESPRQMREVETLLKHHFGHQLHISRFKNCYLEIMDAQATKAHALEVIAESYSIDRQEVMAIGDSYNDLPMLQWAGIGVAMGNAPLDIKLAADFVTLSNDEEGVRAALYQYILQYTD
ncbi:Cof-type HAD-IIB family hydrolase [Syntrophomonas erecta]